MQAKEFKVMVLGPRCGKTTFIRQVQGKPQRNTSHTVGANVTPYDFSWSGEKYRVNFWEVGSKYPGLGKQYGTGMDLAVIFIDGDVEVTQNVVVEEEEGVVEGVRQLGRHLQSISRRGLSVLTHFEKLHSGLETMEHKYVQSDRLRYDKWVPLSVPRIYVHQYKLSDTQRILQHAICLLMSNMLYPGLIMRARI